MARRFAALLGLIAFTAIALRGVVVGRGAEAVICDAIGVMFMFAIVGAVAGWIADMIVAEAAGSKSSERLSH